MAHEAAETCTSGLCNGNRGLCIPKRVLHGAIAQNLLLPIQVMQRITPAQLCCHGKQIGNMETDW